MLLISLESIRLIMGGLGTTFITQRGLGACVDGGMQTDAPINGGSSGGALLDSGGRLVGISTATFSRKGTVSSAPSPAFFRTCLKVA